MVCLLFVITLVGTQEFVLLEILPQWAISAIRKRPNTNSTDPSNRRRGRRRHPRSTRGPRPSRRVSLPRQAPPSHPIRPIYLAGLSYFARAIGGPV